MKVFFPGSFDPPTKGHFDLIERTCQWAERVVVGVGFNSQKKSLLTPEERLELITARFKLQPKVDVIIFQGLTANQAKTLGLSVIVRGLRNHLDFEYERQMDRANSNLYPGLQTIYIGASSQFESLSSSLCREILKLGGNLDWALTPEVENAVRIKVIPI